MKALKSRLSASLMLLALVAGSRAQSLPTGFVLEPLAGGLQRPTALAPLPDGRFLVTEQVTGAIKLFAQGTTAAVGQVSGLATSYSQGLLGIAVDPSWPSRPYVYLWHNEASPPSMRLSMSVASGSLADPASTNLALGPLWTVLEIPDLQPVHNGGALRFGPDGMLYVSLGDDGLCCDAQVLAEPRGKILRLQVSALPWSGPGVPPIAALVPLGNPFVGQSGIAPLVWAYGLRNPFRFHIDPSSGALFIADVNEVGEEEINFAPSGGRNFGWPHREGTVPTTTALPNCGGANPQTLCGAAPVGPSDPLIAVPRGPGPASIISLGVLRTMPGAPWSFGPSHADSYFYVDFYAGLVRRLRFDGVSWTPAPPVPGQPDTSTWAAGIPRVVDAVFAPDGALTMLRYPSSGVGSLERIRPAQRQLTLLAGGGQAGNAGTPLPTPIAVRLASATGDPLPGIGISVSLAAGSGSMPGGAVVTDSSGVAVFPFVPDPNIQGDALILVSAPGASPLTIPVTWRGLIADHDPLQGRLTLTVVHSAMTAPLAVAAEAPPVLPYLVTSAGTVWTSILAPSPSLILLDGLGIAGPPNPTMLTGALQPTWTFTLTGLPPAGGLPLLIQAYALDPTRSGQPDALLISNPSIVLL